MTEFAIRNGKRNRPPETDEETVTWVLYLKQQFALNQARECLKNITNENVRNRIAALLDEGDYKRI